MSLRAKFKCTRFESSIQQVQNPKTKEYEKRELRTVCFVPVYGSGDPNHENTKFFAYSPSGEIKLGTVNPEAWKAFELEKEYYVDFTPAPAPAT